MARNYVKMVVGFDYDPNSAGSAPNIVAVFNDSNEAEGFTGELHEIYVPFRKETIMQWVAAAASGVFSRTSGAGPGNYSPIRDLILAAEAAPDSVFDPAHPPMFYVGASRQLKDIVDPWDWRD
jgi:hypothetical protein